MAPIRAVAPPLDGVRLLQTAVGNGVTARALAGGTAVVHRQIIAGAPAVAGSPAATRAALLAYTKVPVTGDGRSLRGEIARVLKALAGIQPSAGAALKDQANAFVTALTGLPKAPTAEDAAEAVRLLTVLVAAVNQAIVTYRLDDAAPSVTARVEEDDSHHMNYFFKLPNDDAEKIFDLDRWSRKNEDFHKGNVAGPTITGIVDEAVNDWDPAGGGIVPLLLARLVGRTHEPVSGSAGTQDVSALFMNSPLGRDYVRILLAADHILRVRTKDLTPRGVNVDSWRKPTPAERKRAAYTVDWPRLLPVARARIRTEMLARTPAAEDRARSLAVEAIMGHDTVSPLVNLGVVKADAATGEFALNNRRVVRGVDVCQAQADDRFNFDISHVKAILFFEWKAVADLQRG
ncbi:hypothetical protein [Pseudactinotalea sp. HY158]|uniref:hypothetical protein n=1 Tax=Pseudactinotalea sp. HY158 TaxID=2654547 RepID=UPI00129CF4C3|nr:hypothetical protein [Pseudactinotalea sp. HY158]QGH70134.1 hypothetical protein GCE65_11900 [Pseudactinotalea sp. HY158]